MILSMRQQSRSFLVRSRLAWLLAMLAVLWHAGMGVQSAQHQTRMALAPTPEAMLEVCTAEGMVYVALPDWAAAQGDSEEAPDPTVLQPYCALCAAAALDTLPVADAVLPVPALGLVGLLQASPPVLLVGHPSWALSRVRAPPVLS